MSEKPKKWDDPKLKQKVYMRLKREHGFVDPDLLMQEYLKEKENPTDKRLERHFRKDPRHKRKSIFLEHLQEYPPEIQDKLSNIIADALGINPRLKPFLYGLAEKDPDAWHPDRYQLCPECGSNRLEKELLKVYCLSCSWTYMPKFLENLDEPTLRKLEEELEEAEATIQNIIDRPVELTRPPDISMDLKTGRITYSRQDNRENQYYPPSFDYRNLDELTKKALQKRKEEEERIANEWFQPPTQQPP